MNDESVYDEKSGLYIPRSVEGFELREEGFRRWTPSPVPQVVKALGNPAASFKRKRLGVVVSWDLYLPDNRRGYHLSISHAHRYPTWDEITRARYDLVPHDVTMIQVLPPMGEYVNLHPNCFHLWQVADDLSLFIEAQWRKKPGSAS